MAADNRLQPGDRILPGSNPMKGGFHFTQRTAEAHRQKIKRSQSIARQGAGAAAVREREALRKLRIDAESSLYVVRKGRWDLRWYVVAR